MKITLSDPLLRFAQEAETPRVSIYYPTHRGGPETRQDPIRLKNLLRIAEERLGDLGHADKAKKILKPVWNLIPDTDFWTHQQEGLALFASPSGFRHFHLPYEAPELAVASNDFYLKPLLPLFSKDEHFYILALSKNVVKLYEANRYSIRHIEVPSLPESMAESLQYDDGQPELQQRSIGPTVNPKNRAAQEHGAGMFHGHGGAREIRDEELLRYFRTVNRGLLRQLNGSQLPLVLAGVDYYFPIYREANTYPHLLGEGVSGALESMPESELREKAFAVAESHLNTAQRKMLERFHRVAYSNGNDPKNATREIDKAVIAAFEGRVDALVIPREREVWGEFDERTEEVKRGSTDPSRKRELLDFAAMQTLLHGGELFLVPREGMPPDAEVAALLRYNTGLIEQKPA